MTENNTPIEDNIGDEIEEIKEVIEDVVSPDEASPDEVAHQPSKGGQNNTTRNIIILVVLLIFLSLCCCILFGAAIVASGAVDSMLNQLSSYPQLVDSWGQL